LYARQWADSADDLVQEAFRPAGATVAPPGQVLPWLYRVIRNQALANHRSTTRRRQRETRSGNPEAWYVPGGFVFLTALAFCSLPDRSDHGQTRSDDKPTEPNGSSIVVDSDAACEPVPALKYRLIPSPRS